MSIDYEYEKVIELAKEIGELQRSYFRKKDLIIATKSTAVDMLTEVDTACDIAIVDKIKAWFPNDAILSEEQGTQPNDNEEMSSYTWIIDPLDGTTNFSIGHPIFAVSIARWQGDSPEFGVVYVPMLDELFYAQKGKGAYMNHEKIIGSKQSILNQSVLATGFPYDRATAQNNNSENVEIMIPKVKGIRRMGAAAYDLCLVAAGVFDGYWELRLGQWDMAAGSLMILESGGDFRYTVDNNQYNVIAGSKELCDQIASIVNMSNKRTG